MTDERTPILVLPMSRLARDLLERAVRGRNNVELVELPEDELAEARRDGHALARIVDRTGARFVVSGLDDLRPPRGCQELLDERADRVRVIGLEGLEAKAVVFELKPRHVQLPPSTPDEVVDALRRAVGIHPVLSEGA